MRHERFPQTTQAQIDESIDGALHALTHRYDAVPGFEVRLQQRLADRAVQPRRHSLAPHWNTATRIWAGAFACAFLVLLITHYRFRPQQPLAQGAPAAENGTRLTHNAINVATNATGATIPLATPRDPARKAPARATNEAFTASIYGSAQAAVPVLTSAEQAMMDDLHAPSHPAPPLRPTAPERAMFDVVRRGDPVQVAALNSQHRAEVEETERAEVERFFYVPPPAKLPDDDHTSSISNKNALEAKENKHAVPFQPPSPTPLEARRAQHSLRVHGARRTDA
jgi:hypothetical protein